MCGMYQIKENIGKNEIGTMRQDVYYTSTPKVNYYNYRQQFAIAQCWILSCGVVFWIPKYEYLTLIGSLVFSDFLIF